MLHKWVTVIYQYQSEIQKIQPCYLQVFGILLTSKLFAEGREEMEREYLKESLVALEKPRRSFLKLVRKTVVWKPPSPCWREGTKFEREWRLQLRMSSAIKETDERCCSPPFYPNYYVLMTSMFECFKIKKQSTESRVSLRRAKAKYWKGICWKLCVLCIECFFSTFFKIFIVSWILYNRRTKNLSPRKNCFN